MKYTAVLALSVVGLAQGFVVAPTTTAAFALSKTPVRAVVDDDVDFDAPTERAAAVGNVVRSSSNFIFGVQLPSFLSNFFNKEDGNNAPSKFEVTKMDLDDECYLGKDHNLEECADFDP